MNYRKWFIIRVLVLVTILLCIIPLNDRVRVLKGSHSLDFLRNKTLICVIDTGDDLFGKSGLQAGLNYELFKLFAQKEHLHIEIRSSQNDEHYIDSLRSSSVDIIARILTDSTDMTGLRKSVDVDRHCAWYLREDEREEMKTINKWLARYHDTKEYKNLIRRFYTSYDPFKRMERGVHSSDISPYDDLIKKYAQVLGWDWKLLAALIYQESKYSINSHSRQGASGLMQTLPSTAAYYGIYDLLDPEESIKAGTKHLARLQKAFEEEELNEMEKLNFTIAAYNAGEGRIADCRWFAREHGLNPSVWADVVTIIPEMRKYTMIREDGTERTSYFRGSETINYVERVWEIYDAFCEITGETETGSESPQQ